MPAPKPRRPSIRPWAASDVESLIRHANNRAVWRNMRNRFPHPYTKKDARAWIRFARSLKPQSQFAVDLDGQAVGGVGILLTDDIERISGELGYWIGEEHWGKGLATHAAREMTSYGFDKLGLHRVFATPFTRNTASVRVLEKLGFRREGVLVENAIKDGEIVSEVVYAITAPEWRELLRQPWPTS
jgi:ribosomal-protein-alanine N-acetyltransferase